MGEMLSPGWALEHLASGFLSALRTVRITVAFGVTPPPVILLPITA